MPTRAIEPDDATQQSATRPGAEQDVDYNAAESLLRQILQEMRLQRSAHHDFSYLRMFAVVLQMVAFVCMVGMFWLGGSDPLANFRWFALAVTLQLLTLALFQFDRRH